MTPEIRPEGQRKRCEVFLFIKNGCILNKATVPFIQSPCLSSLVPILSPPQYVLIVCVAMYPRDGMVPMKSSNNFLAPCIRKLHFSYYTIMLFLLL